MNPRRLIVNADDCNLTPGVTRGILRAHDQGIVTSTTVMMNLPLSEKTIRELKKRRGLGLGVHLNVTFGEPVSPRRAVCSLLKPEGVFKRPADYFSKRPAVKELSREYDTQVRLFERHFARKPDHLDTHHHLHDDPLFFEALARVARRWKIPIRRSRIFQQSPILQGIKTTDYLFGNLEAHFYWQRDSFLGIAENLPEGTSEIGCHPGYCDAELRRVSSLQEIREKEFNLFSDKRLRKTLSNLGLELIRFSEI